MDTNLKFQGQTAPTTITWTFKNTQKRGRLGYALFLVNTGRADYPWTFAIEEQAGHPVVSSDNFFRSKWDAHRSASRLTDKIKHVYVEDQDGNKTREL